ncbi:MAG: hypothetical protein LKM39_00355 [Chiayiivirga sp.]|nr:hypothetical protein [Chiayiivirga sp.]
MLIAAREHGCLARVLLAIALSSASRTRASARGRATRRPPTTRTRCSPIPKSEFIGILKLWEAYRDGARGAHAIETARLVRQALPRRSCACASGANCIGSCCCCAKNWAGARTPRVPITASCTAP